MTIKIDTNEWAIGEEVLAADLNETFDAVKPIQEFTLGENITAPAPVYVKESDGKIYKASSAAFDELMYRYIGVLLETGVTNNVKKVSVSGVVGGFSFGNPTTTVAATNVYSIAGTTDDQVSGNQTMKRQMFTTHRNQGNISSFLVTLKRGSGTPNGALTFEIFATDDTGAATGSALASKSFVSADLTTSYAQYDIITSALTVKPSTKYVVVVSNTSSNLNGTTIEWFIRRTNTVLSSTVGGELIQFNGAGNEIFSSSGSLEFTMKKTTTRNYFVGDNLYLNDTAGTLGLDPGTTYKKVGEILSTSAMLVKRAHDDEFLGKSGQTGLWSNSFPTNLYLPIPRNTKKIIIWAYLNNGSVKSSAQMILHIDEGSVPTLQVIGDNSGVNPIKFTISSAPALGGFLVIDTIAAITLKAYYYS